MFLFIRCQIMGFQSLYLLQKQRLYLSQYHLFSKLSSFNFLNVKILYQIRKTIKKLRKPKYQIQKNKNIQQKNKQNICVDNLQNYQKNADIIVTSSVMSQNTRNKYKFSIINLALVNQAYPLDFFFRIREFNQVNYQDSPIIQANQMECDEVFPWQFAVNTTQLRIQFIEISNSSGVEIVRGQCIIKNMTNDDYQSIPILANRTGRKLSIITYKLQSYFPRNRYPQQQKKKAKKNHFDQSWNSDESIQQQKQKYKQKPIQKTLSKDEQRQLSKQIANLNNSIDKILHHQKTQHQRFNQYLNESTSFIRQIIGKTKQNSRVNQSLALSSPNILKQINQGKQSQRQSDRSQKSTQISSKIWYQKKYNRKIPEALISKNFKKQLNNSRVLKAQDTSLQYSQSEIQSSQQSLILSDLSFNCESKPNQIIFSQYQNKKPIVKIKSEQGGYQWVKPIKLPDLPVFIITTKKQNDKQLQGCIAKKEFQNQRVILYDLNGQQKGFAKFKFKKLKIYSVQTHEILEMPQIKEDQNKQLDKSKNIHLIQNKEQISLQKQNQNLTRPQQSASKRASRLKMLNQQKRYSTNRDEKQQMQNKQGANSPNQKSNRFQLMGNSAEVKAIPFLKNRHTTQISQKNRTSFMFDADASDGSTSQLLASIRPANIKIDSISIKLAKNTNQFVGKYVKISMKNKNPFVTQTISLSQNLVWKGKGFFFDNVSPYAQIKVQLCTNQNNKQVVEGVSKICLALLNMQKINTVQFYHDYLRDQNQNHIGELILGYESIQRKKRSQSHNRYFSDGLQEQQKQADKAKQNIIVKKKKKKLSRQKSKERKNTSPTHRSQKKQNIGLYGSQSKSIVGSAGIIRTKKYTGGNIIIGRAARFKKEDQYRPGPGDQSGNYY